MRLRIALLSLLLLAGCGGFGNTAPTPTPEVPEAPDILQVVADARVLPTRSVELHFLSGGIVAEILAAEGDAVAAGAPLARLDARELELARDEAQAALAEAQAAYDQLNAGVGPEVIAVQQAALAQAQARSREVVGSVVPQDLAAARAALEQARATLARLEAGPRRTDIAAAEASVLQAQALLQSRRDALAATKSNAAERLTQAANGLRDAQAFYSRTYWDNRERERLLRGKELDRISIDAEESALRAVRNAEAALEQARVELELARQAELSDTAAAEAQLREAVAQRDRVLAGAERDELVAARATVAAAEANVAHLSGDARAGQVEAAEAGVAQAAADLERVRAAPRGVDLAAAEARIRRSEIILAQAELALERATLRAPFAGTVVVVDLEAGALAPTNRPAIVMADFATWRLETSDLTELDIALVRVGAPVAISFDAVPDLTLPGTVTRIKALGQSYQGDVIYTVVITPSAWDARLRWNMTATVAIDV
ncbi:MAG TPA: HlyD family efflux transporter periplasmic adaptor subunit [Roseiflexaceae bacterium]|nr:HlyD family efflux transporter periplasmic adaptor subunit [Roseiflexaceae bacterium]